MAQNPKIRYPSTSETRQSVADYNTTSTTIQDIVNWAKARDDQNIPEDLSSIPFLLYEWGEIAEPLDQPQFRKVMDPQEEDRMETAITLEAGKTYELLPIKFIVSVEIENEQNIFGVEPEDLILPDLNANTTLANFVRQRLFQVAKSQFPETAIFPEALADVTINFQMFSSINPDKIARIQVSSTGDKLTVSMPETLRAYRDVRLDDKLIKITIRKTPPEEFNARAVADVFAWTGIVAAGLGMVWGGIQMVKVQRDSSVFGSRVRVCSPEYDNPFLIRNTNTPWLRIFFVIPIILLAIGISIRNGWFVMGALGVVILMLVFTRFKFGAPPRFFVAFGKRTTSTFQGFIILATVSLLATTLAAQDKQFLAIIAALFVLILCLIYVDTRNKFVNRILIVLAVVFLILTFVPERDVIDFGRTGAVVSGILACVAIVLKRKQT